MFICLILNIPYNRTVAADISRDSQQILLKTYNDVYYWQRINRSISDTLSSSLISTKYQMEPQGEAIAWQSDGLGFFTLSENRGGIDPLLYFYVKE